MATSRGGWVPLSASRRLVCELMHACRGIPHVAVQRKMELGELVAARRLWEPRPFWSTIFIKAFALVAKDFPALRRSYIRFPWAHLYEHSTSVATVTIDRHYEGEETVVLALARSPETQTLADLDAHLRRFKDAPPAALRSFRRARRLAALPWPLRRLAMWVGLHASGRLRERFFGTFCLTSAASLGVGALLVRTPLTTGIHYGQFEPDGRLDMRLTLDHRVFDGVIAARALVAMEETLRGPLLEELRRPVGARAA
jgi:hypothetical protein